MEIAATAMTFFAALQLRSRLIYSVLCILAIVIQACYLNYVFAKALGILWCFWALADVIVISAFISNFVISNRIWKKSIEKNQSAPTTYPLSCLAWFIYSLIVSIKIGIFYGPHTNAVNKYYDALDSFYLRIGISLCSIVFLLLVLIHQDRSVQNIYEVEGFGKTISIDLLDTVQFLDLVIFEESQIAITYNMHTLIIVIACMNILLPITMLISFSSTEFGKFSFGITLEIIHLVYHSLLNIPMVVVRGIVTAHFNGVSSVFFVKNVINVFLSVKNFIYNVLDIYKSKRIRPDTSIELKAVES